MKVLACLWGLTNNINIDNILSNVKNIYGEEIDFLISTWDDQNFDESKFKFVIRSKTPNKEYLDSIGFPYTQQIKNISEWHSLRLGHYAQFYHNYRISKFLDSLSEYDVLIKSRTDVFFETDFNFDFSLDTCYIPEIYWASKGVGINDHFICGGFEYVKKSIFINKFEEFFIVIENSWNPETVNQRLILLNNCKYTEFNCKSYLLLPDRKML